MLGCNWTQCVSAIRYIQKVGQGGEGQLWNNIYHLNQSPSETVSSCRPHGTVINQFPPPKDNEARVFNGAWIIDTFLVGGGFILFIIFSFVTCKLP